MLNASLRMRVRKLEKAEEIAKPHAGRADQMRLARERRLAMSPEERAAADQERLARGIAELAAPDRPDDGAQLLLRRFAQRHLLAAAYINRNEVKAP